MREEELLQEQQIIAAAVKRLNTLKLRNAFSAERPDLEPTPAQLAILKDDKTLSIYVAAANRSGKTQLGARIAAWLFTNTHPYFKRPVEWGDGPILMMIVGRTRELIEVEIWQKKILPLIDPSCYKAIYNGTGLQRVVHKTTGNTITFGSHEGNKQARDKLQGYTAHWTWVDELPADSGVFTELQVRTMTNRGRFIATFTPLVRNEKVKNMVDKADGVLSKKYSLLMLDNPLFKGREEEVIKQMANYSTAEREARLYGKWYYGDKAVYPFDSDLNCSDLPERYHPSWRHIEAVDPAASGKFGFILIAEDPLTTRWHVRKAMYLAGDAPSKLLDIIEEETENFNIVKRTCDPAESWFIKEAALRKRYYMGASKHERKQELIEKVRQMLFDRTINIPSFNIDLIQELNSCQYHDDIEDKIIHAKKFHCADALQYALDVIPKPDRVPVHKTLTERLVEADELRRKREASKRSKGRLTGKPSRRFKNCGVKRRWA